MEDSLENLKSEKSKNEELMIEAKGFFTFYKEEISQSVRKGKKICLS